MNTKEQALNLASQGFKVFQLSHNSKIPLKGSHGYKDATNNIDEIRNTFNLFNNLGIGLAVNHLVLVDLDVNNTDQLKDVLSELNKRRYNLPQTYTERTKSGGTHLIYKTDRTLKPTNKTLFSLSNHTGAEIRTDGVIIAPSCIAEHVYQPLNKISLKDGANAPEWIYDALERNDNHNDFNYRVKAPTQKYYTGQKLDAIAQGVENGNRNNWLTGVIGWLFGTGADPETVYRFAHSINLTFVSPPLPDKEVNNIFKSILERIIK